MPRRKLGVVLLVPRPLAAEIDGLRRALGFGAIEQVPVHITLVLPINVAEDQVDDAIDLVHAAAAAARPVHVVLGPVDTFSPVTPVVYLRVSGPGLDDIARLRDELDSGPLAQELKHPFVPHVTLGDDATPDEIDGATRALAHFVEPVALDTITVLEESADDRIWRPVADVTLGREPLTRTIGAERITVRTHARPSIAGAAIGRYRPIAVEAIVDGRVVGAAVGHLAEGDVAWLDELVVTAASRGAGVGAALARGFVDAARHAGCTEVRAARGASVAGFLAGMGFAASPADEFVLVL